MPTPSFEELYVVSDLHLGGTHRAPIFKREKEKLSGLFDWLAERQAPAGGTLALVLNGDVIDTLAEAITGYVATPQEAESVCADIIAYFPTVFAALAKFVKQPKHRLVVVIGNHDLELAYPNVQEAFVEALAGADEAARGRIQFVTTGAGFRCAVGSAKSGRSSVLCVHGNEFDDWNAVSSETMTRLLRAAVLGLPSERTSETPNAGTKLVVDVMNAVKADWPFVDLLKPEIDSVFNVLLALDPKRITALRGVIAALQQAVTQGKLRTSRLLGAEASSLPAESGATADWQPGQALLGLIGAPADASVTLNHAWALADQDVAVEDLAERGEVLGGGRLVWNLLDYAARSLLGQSREKALRAALLDWGGGQETWALDGACEVFDRLVELGPKAQVVIAGHTHLRRQKRFPGVEENRKRPLYLNTGTWARLLRLTTELLNSPQRFSELFTRLKAGSMEALDDLPNDVLLNQATVAVVRADGADVRAALCEYVPQAVPAERIALVEDATWATLEAV